MSRVWPEACGSFGVFSLSLDPELCGPPSLWLLVEIKGVAPGVRTRLAAKFLNSMISPFTSIAVITPKRPVAEVTREFW